MLPLQVTSNPLECGVDEAGRGCLAGPVTAAAVILPPHFNAPDLTDSKQLSEKKRNVLRVKIEQEALCYAVAHVSEKQIDATHILKASILAMHKAIDKLSKMPDFIAVDGNKFYKYKNISHQTVIKGDGKFLNIAAASILAKTYRDAYMHNLALKHPEYGWHTNKGYPTKTHRDAIKKYGITPYHRKSFTLLPKVLELPF